MPRRLTRPTAVLLVCASVATPVARVAGETPPVDAQVKKTLTWIARAQRAEGRWPAGLPGEEQPGVILLPGPRTVVTASFCGLALLASGDKRYQAAIDRAANYVAANLVQDNRLTETPPNMDRSNWNVAIGGLFLCEYAAALKETRPNAKNARLQQALDKLADEAVRRMEDSGGWGHTPRLTNELGYVELEVMSNWMLAMLGAAERLGAKQAPPEKVQLALHFVEDSCKDGDGGVGYSPREGQKGFGDPGRTGGALFAFAMVGQEGHPLYPRMAAYWRKSRDESADGHGSIALGLLGSALGARQLGGGDWDGFAAKFFPPILAAANEDGSFKHLTSVVPRAANGSDETLGVAYNTGIYALLLQLGTAHLKLVGQKLPPLTAAAAAAPAAGTETEAARLGDELVKAPAGKQEEVLARLRDGKGALYTDTLAQAVGKLEGSAKAKARDALADRLARMTSKTLGDKLLDDDLEVRRAAALACAMKEDRKQVPRLIELLADPEPPVARAAHAALKTLTEQDLGPDADASRADIAHAIATWKEWWKRQSPK
jgi:hypothetical protein